MNLKITSKFFVDKTGRNTRFRALLVVFLITMNFFGLYAQTHQKDVAAYKEVELLLKNGESLRNNRKISESIKMVRQATDKAKSLNNKELIIKSKSFLARVYCSADSLTLARQTIDSCLRSVTQKESTAYAYILWAKANLENYLDNNEDVFRATQHALHLLENNANEDWLKSKLLYLEYLVYVNMDDWGKALSAVQKSLDFAVKTNDFNHQSICYAGMASVYKIKYRESKKQQDIIAAEGFLLNAYRLSKAHEESVSAYARSIACNNLADIYTHFIQNKALSEKYLEEALQAARLSGNQNVLSAVLGIQSRLALENKQNGKAEQLLLSGYTSVKQATTPNLDILKTFTADLSLFYEKEHRYSEALQYQKEYSHIQSQLFEQQSSAQIRKLETIHKIAQQETELQNIRKTNRQRQIIIYLCLLAIFLIAIAMFFIWRTKKLKIEEMQMQKQHDDLQLKLEQEENMRITAEKQLAEAEKNNLKKALLAGKLHIEHKNKVLKKIDKNISEGQDVKVKKIIRKETGLDNSFSLIERQIVNTLPHFFDTLHARATQKLTPLDLKICTYLLLEMDTKQIAGLLNITPKSVLMTKYRVKQKLNLPNNIKLDVFIQNLSENNHKVL